MSENLFAYTISNYSESEAGAITGARAGNTVDTTAAKGKITGLNGDAACFNYTKDNTDSELVFRQYTYSTTSLLPNRFVASQGNWGTPEASATWDGIANMHAVASKGNYLFATGYDLAKVVVADMDDATNPYSQKFAYDFPAALAEEGHVYHGEGVAVLGNYLYVLFSNNTGTGYYADYEEGYVVQYSINMATGALTYTNKFVRVGKNGFTLELYGRKLYVCALGGMQQAGTTNPDTCISIVTVNALNNMSVAAAKIPTTGVSGDFRDISIVDGYAYIFAGYYASDYNTFNGKIYRVAVADLELTGKTWDTIKSFADPGYFWAIHAEGYSNKRFWFVKGNVIEVYTDASGSSLGTAPYDFDAAALAVNSSYTNINAACFIAANAAATTRSAAASAGSKSCIGHARLAREAYELAQKAKK